MIIFEGKFQDNVRNQMRARNKILFNFNFWRTKDDSFLGKTESGKLFYRHQYCMNFIMQFWKN